MGPSGRVASQRIDYLYLFNICTYLARLFIDLYLAHGSIPMTTLKLLFGGELVFVTVARAEICKSHIKINSKKFKYYIEKQKIAKTKINNTISNIAKLERNHFGKEATTGEWVPTTLRLWPTVAYNCLRAACTNRKLVETSSMCMYICA